MQNKTLVQITALLSLVGLAVVLAFDGVRVEVTIVLVLAILGVAAPEALDKLELPWTE